MAYKSLFVVSLIILFISMGLVAKSALPPQHFDTADDSVVLNFANHDNLWLARRFGCTLPELSKKQQETPTVTLTTCWAAAAFRDNEEWRKARELAKTVFDLREK